MDVTKLTRPARKLLPLKTCGAVIVAAGNASRMGGIDKVMALLGGEPMIVRTVRAFQNCDAIASIVIVTREDLIRPISGLCRDMSKVTAVVCGGSSRQESVHLGLNAPSWPPFTTEPGLWFPGRSLTGSSGRPTPTAGRLRPFPSRTPSRW